jgi:hypothetical protein
MTPRSNAAPKDGTIGRRRPPIRLRLTGVLIKACGGIAATGCTGAFVGARFVVIVTLLGIEEERGWRGRSS